MKLYFIFTKKGLAVIFSLVIVFLIVFGQLSTVSQSYIDGSTNQKRIEFLNSLGLKVNETAVSVKETRIPQKLTGVYFEYSQIQKDAGFKLSDFCGKAATHYVYILNDNPQKTVNVLVVKDKIIAGDITNNISGEILPLIKEK